MRRLTKPDWRIVFIALMGIVIFTFSCDESSTDPVDLGPDVPPISTFLLDFGAFPGLTAEASGVAQSATHANWGWAGINILVWNAVITVHAAVPVAAYLESFKHTPVRQEDGSWMWSYTVNVGEDTYTAKLYASTDLEGISWSMYLSQAGEFTDFLWFEGGHDLLYTEGGWTLYKNPDEPVDFIEIEWSRDLQNATSDIIYTNVEPESEGNGGYITYGITENPDYDAFYDIFIIEQEHYIDIEWNLVTKAGRVMDETHFEDTDWHCWDESLEDIDCVGTK